VTCPHCWHSYGPDEIVWVAKHDELRGDPVLGSDDLVRFRPSRFNMACEALDGRGMTCQTLACPQCHLVTPRVCLESRPLFFSIIGSPASGKSYFLGAMTWQLRGVMPRKFSVAFTDADISGNQILNRYEETLFQQSDSDQLVTIEKTELEGELYRQITLKEQTVLLPRPFLFNMRPTGAHPYASESEQESRLLCLYDNAGEHFLPGADTSIAPGTQHVARSRVLMYLYDPTQLPRFCAECRKHSDDPQLSDAATTFRQDTILTEAALRVRQYAGMPATAKLEQPLLVLVAKSDVWSKLIDEDVITDPYVDAPSDGPLSRVDFPRIQRVSAQVRDLLLDLTPEFVAAAEDACADVTYIPVSALGRSPELVSKEPRILGIRPKEIRSRWVTVPMLYAFGKWSTRLIARVKE